MDLLENLFFYSTYPGDYGLLFLFEQGNPLFQ